MNRWNGCVAVVTGASSGIGAAVVETFAELGLLVAGMARRAERVQQLADKLKDKPGKVYAIRADITKEEDIIHSFKWIKENLGAVHILVNNAGVNFSTSLIDGDDTKLWKQTLDTDVLGLCIATREAIRDMRTNDVDGHIIHINSIVGHTVPNLPNYSVYIAAKHAVTSLTETLRQELRSINSKIKITSISPGRVDTEMRLATKAKDFIELPSNIPRLRIEDIADAIIYVLSTPPHVQVHELIIKPIGEDV